MTPATNAHFEELRRRINERLEGIRGPHRRAQIDNYPWLYGALGEVPSDVMFICENPSLAGVANAHVATVDGRAPDIEAQWWGGPRNPAATRFRVALHRLGLKTSHPSVKGGWRCYITNVIKEMNVASDNQRLSPSDRRAMAEQWATILAWEIEQVQPKHVVCVGGASHEHVKRLVEARLIPRIRPHLVNHYSGRTGDRAIIDGIMLPVSTVLASPMRDVFPTFRAFIEEAVLPHRDAHPDWIRLDGAQTGGNWEVFGRFERAGARWKVHSDSHFEPLLIANEAASVGDDPFVEAATTRGLRLDLREDLARRVKSGFRHLYIYNDRPAR